MDAKPDVVTLTLNPALDVSTSVARVEPVHKLRCAAPRFDPGGGGVNVARVVQRLGAAALAVYPAGGPTGQRLSHLLAAEQTPRLAVDVAGDTRESFNITDRRDGAEYRFILPGPELTEFEWRGCLDAALAAAAAGGALLVASGGLPSGAPPQLLAELAGRARDAGIRLAVDSSGAPLAAALEAGVWLVKPNLRELSDHAGRALPDTPARLRACRELIAAGSAEIVALSLSGEGALLATRDGAWSAPALDIRPASTVGAGDSFLGGLLWALCQGMPPGDGLRYGLAAGAAALLSPGTELCHRADVLRFAEEVLPVSLAEGASPGR